MPSHFVLRTLRFKLDPLACGELPSGWRECGACCSSGLMFECVATGKFSWWSGYLPFSRRDRVRSPVFFSERVEFTAPVSERWRGVSVMWRERYFVPSSWCEAMLPDVLTTFEAVTYSTYTHSNHTRAVAAQVFGRGKNDKLQSRVLNRVLTWGDTGVGFEAGQATKLVSRSIEQSARRVYRHE